MGAMGGTAAMAGGGWSAFEAGIGFSRRAFVVLGFVFFAAMNVEKLNRQSYAASINCGYCGRR
jgi:hypothetical protein